MSMDHKAYAFNWTRFDLDLHPLLVDALAANDTTELEAFTDQHRQELTDPYEGAPLPEDWRAMLENRDVHEFGDFALTRHYNPRDEWGVGEEWMELSEQLSEAAVGALLGSPVGPPEARFDPGRLGSYFQTPAMVRESQAMLRREERPELQDHLRLLEQCVAARLGVYVTF